MFDLEEELEDDQDFVCYVKDSNDSPLAVQEGDILGVCVSDPRGLLNLYNNNALNVVGEASGESLLSVTLTRNCFNRVLNNFPATVTIQENPSLTVDSIRLHLSANIGLLSYLSIFVYMIYTMHAVYKFNNTTI